MRKIFRITSLAFMLLIGVSCNKDIPGGSAGKYPILFRSMEETRAQATVGTMQDDAYGFNVYAFFTTPTATGLSFTKNVKYTNGSWTYQHNNQGLEYWIPGATYWFKALYPAGIGTVDNTNRTQAVTISNFDITTQKDILVAETGELDVDNTLGAPVTGSTVNLQFKHLLACVVVKIKAEVDVTINNVSLKYVQVKGTYEDGSWEYSSQGNIVKDGLNKSLSSSSNAYHDVTDGGFLVFPSSVDGVQLYIETSDKTYELPLKTPNSWVMGTKYTYTLTIKQNDIHFDEPTVEEWDEENAVGSVIIK